MRRKAGPSMVGTVGGPPRRSGACLVVIVVVVIVEEKQRGGPRFVLRVRSGPHCAAPRIIANACARPGAATRRQIGSYRSGQVIETARVARRKKKWRSTGGQTGGEEEGLRA
mmetsp:Transcript_8479/g.26449  ORF Transcript_8479/g.26449 Transcript_8479/m.26449 type:complete len:112 (-) Transcript_8479:1329-1664(-)